MKKNSAKELSKFIDGMITNNYRKTLSRESEKSEVRISLCLEDFMDGLHAEFTVTEHEGDKISFLTLSINGEPIAFYDMEWMENLHNEEERFDVEVKIIRKIENE